MKEVDSKDLNSPLEVPLKAIEPTITFETAKTIMKTQFNKSKTEEALLAYDEKKRLDKKAEKAPSYIGVSKNKNPNKELTRLDQAAIKIKD